MKKILFIGLILAYQLHAAESDLKGQLVNAQNQGIPYVTIKINNSEQQVRSAEDGSFTFATVPEGRVELDIEISGSSHFNTQVNHDGQLIIINADALTLDQMIVSAVPLEHSMLEMTTPAAIIDETELVLDRGTSVDQTISRIPGVNSGGFGRGAGQIIIRGQQGPRVTVLNNNQTLQDASRVSPDHWITTEPLLAKQIEVLKGPATLLYGGGAIGGVVNVIDEVIPDRRIDGIQGAVEGRFSDDTSNERAGVVTINAGLSDRLMGHISYFNTRTDDYKIPSNAESEILHEAEEHDEHDEEEEGLFGVLENSSIDSDGANVGLSWINDRGYWGVSYADFNRNYGLPGHSHEHEHDDHGEDDHGEDDHGDDHGEEEHEEEKVRLMMDKSVVTVKGVHSLQSNGFVDQFRTHFTDTDYRHVEFEGGENGTVFDNQASEFRFELTHHEQAGLNGILGMQYTSRDFSAIGEEAFILHSETNTWSVFLVEEKQFNGWHGEFGLRYEQQNVETALFNDLSDEALSVSLGANIEINDHWTLPVNLSSAQRLPTAEEYFSNQGDAPELITHLSTALIEVGDINLTHETANHLDVGFRYRHNQLSFDLALFYNQLDDYIYLRDTGQVFEETPIAHYVQQNATFRGSYLIAA